MVSKKFERALDRSKIKMASLLHKKRKKKLKNGRRRVPETGT